MTLRPTIPYYLSMYSLYFEIGTRHLLPSHWIWFWSFDSLLACFLEWSSKRDVGQDSLKWLGIMGFIRADFENLPKLIIWSSKAIWWHRSWNSYLLQIFSKKIGIQMKRRTCSCSGYGQTEVKTWSSSSRLSMVIWFNIERQNDLAMRKFARPKNYSWLIKPQIQNVNY